MRSVVFLLIVMAAYPLTPQPRPRMRPPRTGEGPQAAETAVKIAMEQTATDKKAYERDIEVLRHVRTAAGALVDAMQPATAIQKAYEEIQAAKSLRPEFLVWQGVIRSERELEDARRSPGSADLDHLRSVISDEALGPASRVVVRNARTLQDETLAWIKVHELIAAHLRALTEMSGESLRASDEN